MVALRTYEKKNIKKHSMGRTRAASIPQNTLQPYKKLISLGQSAGNRSIARLMEQEPGKMDQARLLADPNRFLNQRGKKGGTQAGGQETGGENKTGMGNTPPGIDSITAQTGIKETGKSADEDPAKKPALNRIIEDMKIPGLVSDEKEEGKGDDQKERALEEGTERSVEQTDAMRISASPEQIVRAPQEFIDEEARTQTELRPGDIGETHEQVKEALKWLKETLSSPVDSLMSVWDWAKGNLGSITAGVSGLSGGNAPLSAAGLAKLNKIQMMIARQIGFLCSASIHLNKELAKKETAYRAMSNLSDFYHNRMVAHINSAPTNGKEIATNNFLFGVHSQLFSQYAQQKLKLEREIALLQFVIQQCYFLIGIKGLLLMQSQAMAGRATPVHEIPTAEPPPESTSRRAPKHE